MAGKSVDMLIECYRAALQGKKVLLASPLGNVKMELVLPSTRLPAVNIDECVHLDWGTDGKVK